MEDFSVAMSEKKKILLGMPSYKQVDSMCIGAQWDTLADLIRSGMHGGHAVPHGAYITTQRNAICTAAIDMYEREELTHVWFVDDDMIIPEGSIEKLAAHDVPVVGGLYFTKQPRPMAYQLPTFTLYDDIPRSGTIQVDGTGAGCLFVSCALLLAMQKTFGDSRWFDHNTLDADGNALPDRGHGTWQGEDVWFFRRLKKMGVPVLLDLDVKCKHVGSGFVDEEVFDAHRERLRAEKAQKAPACSQ
jgi:hypothetical protein